jgi:hypothetical protein
MFWLFEKLFVTKGRNSMPTVADLIALIQTLPPKRDKLTADSAASDAAVTAAKAAEQAASDAAGVVAASTKDVDDTLDAVIAMATALRV